MTRYLRTIFAVGHLTYFLPGLCFAQSTADETTVSFDALALEYQQVVQPLLKQFCVDCHSTDAREGNLDLERFASFDLVRQDPQPWRRVIEMLDDAEMPPEDSLQPSVEQKTQLRHWVQQYLDAETRARAGDPGPVLLRRLSNAEYTYSVRDLTQVALDPAREFPVDGGAGEGFTNTGSGQAMSPSLVTKYLDAGKDIARHVVLLPDGIRFSRYATRRDQTDELVDRIQQFYRRFTDDGQGKLVNLQGVQFETNQGGLLPVEKYLAATLEERDSLLAGATSLETVAHERSLHLPYLNRLWTILSQRALSPPSLLIDQLRNRWRDASAEGAAQLAAEIAQAQASLWKFNPVGQLGRQGGPPSWLEAVNPLTARQELRLPLPPAPNTDDIVIYLSASDLGDGNDQDFVVWQQPRFEFKTSETDAAHPPVLLRDVRSLVQRIHAAQESEVPRTAEYLKALAQLSASQEISLLDLVKANELNPQLLERWAELTGIRQHSAPKINGQFTNPLNAVQGYQAINGWGAHETPNVLTNSSDQDVNFLTLTVPARGVTVHPSPDQQASIVWRSPIDGQVQLAGQVTDRDDKCGNGAVWQIELQSANSHSLIANGVIENGQQQSFQSPQPVEVRQNDLVSLVVDARDRIHACDTTQIELTLTEVGHDQRTWDLATDVVDNILDGNPLPDSYGHPATWHFCAATGNTATSNPIAPESTLAQWQSAVAGSAPSDQTDRLASSVETILTTLDPDSLSPADQTMRAQLLDWKGPLRWSETNVDTSTAAAAKFGLEASRFGRHPYGSVIDPHSICLQAPHQLEIRLPAAIFAGSEFVAHGVLDETRGTEGSAQINATLAQPTTSTVSAALPFLMHDDTPARHPLATALAEFRDLFPPALCYTRIVPVDEVVTLNLYYREDDHLRRLMLNDEQAAELDRLWDELYYVSQEPLQLAVAFEQIYQFATQDRPDLVEAFEPLRDPINARAESFRARLVATEAAQLDSVIHFADRAWRRPLSTAEHQELRDLYQSLRASELSHEQSLQLLLARVLASPAFLYKLEQPIPGPTAAPISDLELASRLSYFLWSSLPDDELRNIAEADHLSHDDVLAAQIRRMLSDPRTRRLAIEFACQWLHLRDFDQNDDKNEQLYPQFAQLRHDMYEETVRFFEDMFRHDGSILALLDADYTFLNASLASHYNIAGISGDSWRKVDGMRSHGRGGILGMATFLASQSGASRTSPILRGNWVYETLLGERLPRPPANVPQLPDAVPAGLTARQLIEQHSSVDSCAKCHKQIDPYGFALEQYDAIGRIRPESADTNTTLADGTSIDGLDGLRNHLLVDRRDAVVRQFCRKLLGFALGREVLLSDELLLKAMQKTLSENDYRFGSVVETIVLSQQFRQLRGSDSAL